MKKILLLYCALAILGMPRMFAEGGPTPPTLPQVTQIRPTPPPTLPPTTTSQGPTLEVLPTGQPRTIDAPEGVIVPAASITLRGKNGGSEVDGLSVEFHWAEGATGLENGTTDMEGGRGVYRSIPIDGYVLLDGNTPLGPVQTVDYYSGNVIMNRVYIGGDDTRTITVGALMKASLAEEMGKYFSVRITGVTTTARVSGTLPVDGGLKIISDVKAGRLVIVGTVGNNSNMQSGYPLISGQTGMEIHMTAGSQGEFKVPTFTVDARCLGGKANDVQVSLRSNGGIVAGPVQMESSILYGQGSAKFRLPFRVAMDMVRDCQVMYRLGPTWIKGGTIAFSIDNAKCIALGGTDGFLTIPLHIEIISGPLIVVLPVATDFGIDQVEEIDTGNTLVPGQNNFAAIAITPSADKPLAVPYLGGWLGWAPYADSVDNVNVFGYLSYTNGVFSQPILGLQSDGAFLAESVGMKGRREGYLFWPQDRYKNQSAAIILPGEKAYFVLSGSYKPTGAHSKVSAEIFDWNSEETLTMQYKSR